MNRTTRPTPLLQIRVIGPTDTVRAVLDHLADHVRRVAGPNVTCRTQTHVARRVGTIRSYLTVTDRKEEP